MLHAFAATWPGLLKIYGYGAPLLCIWALFEAWRRRLVLTETHVASCDLLGRVIAKADQLPQLGDGLGEGAQQRLATGGHVAAQARTRHREAPEGVQLGELQLRPDLVQLGQERGQIREVERGERFPGLQQAPQRRPADGDPLVLRECLCEVGVVVPPVLRPHELEDPRPVAVGQP